MSTAAETVKQDLVIHLNRKLTEAQNQVNQLQQKLQLYQNTQEDLKTAQDTVAALQAQIATFNS